MDALLEEGMPVPKKMRPAEDKFGGGDSDHQSDGESSESGGHTFNDTIMVSLPLGLPDTELQRLTEC